jgi:hypothetical protein
MPYVEIGFLGCLRGDAGGLQDFHTWMQTLAQHQYNSQQQVDFSEWIPHHIT